MSTQVITFDYATAQLRTVMRDGVPWFVAADVCAALGLPNTTRALERLDEDEQALSSIQGISRGNDQVNVVNESGLYSLILGSRKPEAKAFKRWVTHEVLPSIRKNGYYIDPAAQADLFDQFETEVQQTMAPSVELALLRRLDATQSQLIQTQAELVAALKAQLQPKPKRGPTKRLGEGDIAMIRALKLQGMSNAAIARRLQVSPAAVSYLTRDMAKTPAH